MSENRPKPIQILIVDHQTIVRQGLRALIEKYPGMSIVGEAGSCKEAVKLARQHRPDIILLEPDAGGSTCIDSIPRLRRAARRGRIVILTGMHDPGLHRRAVLLGAMGLVSKDHSSDVLLRAIEKVYAGEAWLDHAMTASVLEEISQPQTRDVEEDNIAALTQRERQIVSIVSEGLKNAQIARRLHISETTVRNHITSILGKLGLSDRMELALYSFQYGLAKPPAQRSGEGSA